MNLKIFSAFRDFPIRYKLLIYYWLVFTLSITLGCVFIYYSVRRTIENNIESELKNSTTTIFNLVQTSASVSIKNHLRATAEQNQKIAHYFHQQFQNGLMSKEDAKAKAGRIMLSHNIGPSGYIYCLDSRGVVKVHPKKDLIDVDVSENEFAQQQKQNRQGGYFEYRWKNPDEDEFRPKAIYWSYFKPWDWIITASAYRKEFKELVNVDDFRESVLSLKFGKTGYSYITDIEGNTIVHPKNQGINIYEEEDNSSQFFNDMLRQKNGKIVYAWKNPGETDHRKKLVIFNYIPQYEWIVASSSYLDEFYAPLNTIRNIVIATICISLVLAFPVTFRISSSITNPLKELMARFAEGAAGDFSVRLQRQNLSRDEVGRLSAFFNSFMERLEAYSVSLKRENQERKAAESALRESEERYRSAMEAVPDPVIVYDLERRVQYLNPAFAKVFGWDLVQIAGRQLDHFVPKEYWPETASMMEEIVSGKVLSALESRRYTLDGNIIDVSISAAGYHDREGKVSGIVLILRDITQSKRMERAVMEIGDRERQKIGQDLHDDLGPHLVGVEGLTKALHVRLMRRLPEERPAVEKIVNFIGEAIEITRRLTQGLCPVHLVDHGLESSLKELATTTKSISNMNCQFICPVPVLIKNNTISTHLFYIAREAVNNAVKHSSAQIISIHLTEDNQQVSLVVEDDGNGLRNQTKSLGMGLKIMQFRSKMIGANLDIHPAAGGGTVIRAILDNRQTGLTI